MREQEATHLVALDLFIGAVGSISMPVLLVSLALHLLLLWEPHPFPS